MYTNFEKEKIGKTFKYYKTIKNIKWDEIKEKSSISKTTYAKMSRGEIVKYERCYDEFLRFFNLSFNRIDNFEYWLNEYLIQLDHALEYNSQYDIKQLYEEYINCLDNHKNEPIYEQYYFSFEWIFKYYLYNQHLNEAELNKLLLFIDSNLLEETIQVYLLEVMYISNNNAIGKDTIRRELAAHIAAHNHPILYDIKANHEKCERRLQCALNIHQKQLEYWNKNNNEYRKLKTMNGMFAIYENIDHLKAEELIKKLELSKESKNIPRSLKKTLNYNIGIYYYFTERYEESYRLFMENIDQFASVKERIFVGSICTRLNKELPNKFLYNDYKNPNYKLYIDYFKNKKQGKSDKDLTEFINETLYYQKLKDVEYYEPLWHIFEIEMDYFLKKSRKNYDAYIKFKEKMDKIVKFR